MKEAKLQFTLGCDSATNIVQYQSHCVFSLNNGRTCVDMYEGFLNHGNNCCYDVFLEKQLYWLMIVLHTYFIHTLMITCRAQSLYSYYIIHITLC